MQSTSKISAVSSAAIADKPYIHWIHCNRCFHTFIKKERSFFLLACQHVICESCLVEVTQDINGPRVYKCSFCLKEARSCQINNAMPNHLKELFHPQPYLNGLDYFRILNFQTVQRRYYREYLERKEISIQHSIKMAIQYKETCKKSYQELRELKSERIKLERRVLAIKMQKQNANDSRQNKTYVSSANSSAKPPLKSRKIGTSPNILSFADFKSKNNFVL